MLRDFGEVALVVLLLPFIKRSRAAYYANRFTRQ